MYFDSSFRNMPSNLVRNTRRENSLLNLLTWSKTMDGTDPGQIANHPPYSIMWCAFVMWLTCDRHVTSSSIGYFSHLSVSQSGLLCVDHCVPCVTVLLDSTVLAVFVRAWILEMISVLQLNRQKGTFTHDLRLNNVSTIFEMWPCWCHYYHGLFVRDHPVWIILLPW